MTETSNLERSLLEIGLNAKEAQVYLALLSLESTTAYRIAEHCKVKRPTVYVILEDLRKKGLVLKTPHAKKTLFSARSIAEYIAEQERGIEFARALVPQFEALRAQPGTAVYFYTGLSGMKDALAYKFDMMRGKTFLSFYCDLSGTGKDIKKLYDAWDKEAIASGIRFRTIRVRDTDAGDTHLTPDEKENIETRYVDASAYPGNISFEVGEDFIRITDAKGHFATIIDSAASALALHQVFSIVWNGAKKH